VNKTLLFPVKQQLSAIKFTKLLFSLLAILIFSGARLARAGMITYQDQVTETGTLGLSAFTNALVTVSLTGDTNNVHPGSVQLLFNTGRITVTIAGLGTATFAELVSNAFTDLNGPGGSARCGIGATGGSVLDTGNPLCGTYDLKTPITVTGQSFFRGDLTYGTDLGAFHMSSVASTSTFTATVVPEPSSISLIGVVIALFVGFNRPRKR
jgi:hypothetical protein